MIDTLKHLLIGSPLPTGRLFQERLNKIRALAAFSPAALSSIAYADQEIYLGLAVAGSVGLSLAFPIGFAITVLLVLVALSYLQTIDGYPSGGGSYVVSRENLGTVPGLIAGAALLIDYVLTAAVSLTAGMEAICSAFPALWSYRVEAALFLLTVTTVLNLRGLRETGTLMAVPVYLFLAAYLPLLTYGAVRLLTSGPVGSVANVPSNAVPLNTFLVLRAFSSGCTALTGIEAISNGVPAFQEPQARNAGRTLIVMAVLMGILFLGSIGLIQSLGVTPGSEETVLSALTRRLVGSGPIYVLIQMSTLLVLAVAANTSFATHYREVSQQLSMKGVTSLSPSPPAPRVVIPVAGVHRGIIDAVSYARSIATDVTAAYVELEPGSGQGIRERWERWWPEVPLVILPSPYRSIVGPLLDFLDETDRQHDDGQLATVVLPEFVPARPWHALLHNQTAWLIKAALLYRRRQLGFQRMVIDVPFHLGR